MRNNWLIDKRILHTIELQKVSQHCSWLLRSFCLGDLQKGAVFAALAHCSLLLSVAHPLHCTVGKVQSGFILDSPSLSRSEVLTAC